MAIGLCGIPAFVASCHHAACTELRAAPSQSPDTALSLIRPANGYCQRRCLSSAGFSCWLCMAGRRVAPVVLVAGEPHKHAFRSDVLLVRHLHLQSCLPVPSHGKMSQRYPCGPRKSPSSNSVQGWGSPDPPHLQGSSQPPVPICHALPTPHMGLWTAQQHHLPSSLAGCIGLFHRSECR